MHPFLETLNQLLLKWENVELRGSYLSVYIYLFTIDIQRHTFENRFAVTVYVIHVALHC